MAIDIIKKHEQAVGAFDFGRIKENKPLGFPQEGGLTRPISNLFYWAHAWSDTGGLIDEHPHQGFEIMSYVLDGTISHYDNKLADWKNLSKGDAQLIKAGNGITHAEKLLPGAHIFQIWFDPNLNVSMRKPAEYSDIPSEDFQVVEENGYSKKVVVGANSPMQLDAEGVEMTEYRLPKGDHTIEAAIDATYGVYLISGKATLNGSDFAQDDYALVKESNSIQVSAEEDTLIFVLKVQNEVSYKTYAQLQGIA